MQASPIDRPWFGPVAALVVVIVAAILGMGLSPQTLEPLIIENGPFEVASVILHLFVAIIALRHWRRGQSIAGILFLASILMAAREADLHKAFTTYGLFKTRLYVDASVPLIEKLLAGGFVLGLIAAMGHMVWKARKSIRQIARERQASFYALSALPVFLLALKEIDGVPRMLRKAGMALSDREALISRSIEEIGETFIPLLVLIILIQLARGPLHAQAKAAAFPATA